MEFKRFPLGIYQANCYILYDKNTKEAAVIDPGGDFEVIKSFVEDSGLKVKYIILTHGHGDHIGALMELKEYTGAEVCIHGEDNPMLRSSRMNLTALMGYNPVEMSADRLLEDGEILRLEGMELEIIHTPGHSRGGICIYCDGSLFSGDTLFACSIGRTDLPGGSNDELIESIKNKLLVLPDDTAVYPGHGPPSTISIEKKRNPFLR